VSLLSVVGILIGLLPGYLAPPVAHPATTRAVDLVVTAP
jgi:hypothetical protein